MRPLLTLLLLGGCVALSACRSKPKKKAAEMPVEPPAVDLPDKSPTRRGGASEAPKVNADRAKIKATAPAPAPEVARPKPPVEPPPVAAKPAASAVPLSVPEPTAKAGANAAAPANAPAKAAEPPPVPQPTVQRNAPDAAKASRPPNPQAPLPSSIPPTSSPKPAATVSKPNVLPPPPQPLPAATRPTNPADGRALEINLAPKPSTTTPATEPIRTAIPSPGATRARPPTVGPILGVVGIEARPRAGEMRSLPLPPGSGGQTNAVTPAPPLVLQFGQGTNQPPATNTALRAIGVDPLLQGVAWREQQLAKQAAEQKAREEEQQKLKVALYRFLLKGGTNR